MKQIGVSKQVKERLDEIKKEQGHRSYDSVLRTLLMKYDEKERMEQRIQKLTEKVKTLSEGIPALIEELKNPKKENS